jgi:hypothetical protein
MGAGGSAWEEEKERERDTKFLCASKHYIVRMYRDVKLNIPELWVSLSSTSWRKAGALRMFQRTVMWKSLVAIPFTAKTS